MAAARFWRMAQVEPYAGGHLELSEVALYDGDTRVDAFAAVSCTVASIGGSLADLRDDSFSTVVRWDGTNPLPPGFALVWDFGAGAPQDITKVGLAGPSQGTFIHKFVLESSSDGLTWAAQLAPIPTTSFCGGGAFYELGSSVGADPYLASVALALSMEGSAGLTAFPDLSPVANTVSAMNGAVIAAAPSKWGRGSCAFDGVDDYLAVPYNIAFEVGTGPFTVEVHFNCLNLSGNFSIYSRSSGTYYITRETSLFIASATTFKFYYGVRGVNQYHLVFTVPTMTLNTWYHLALSRDGNGVFRLFLNGEQAPETYTDTTDLSGGGTLPLAIGGFPAGPVYSLFSGYMNGFRFTRGLARYTASFTPPTAPFWQAQLGPSDPYAASVVLLLRMDGTHGSTTFLEETGKSVTVNGSTQLSTAQSKFGGASAYFDGAGDFLQVADHADFDLPGDFTVEFWLRPETFGSSANGNRCPLSFGVAGLGSASPCLLLGTDGRLLFYTSTTLLTSTAALTLNTWQHVAAVRSGGTLTLFIDGASAGSVSYTTAIAPGGVLIGRSMPTTGDFQGFLDDLRITKGVARYTSSFTPQVLAGAIGGDPYATSVALLLPFDTGTADASGAQCVPSLYGSPVIVSSGQKYGGGALSVGTPDYLRYDTVGPLGTGDYTLECWVYSRRAPSTNSGLLAVGSCIANISTVQGLFLYQNANLNLKLYQNGVKLTASVGLPLAVWTHLAVVRRTGVVTLYVNGVPSGSPFADTNSYLAGVSLGGPSLGGIDALDGLIDDVRVTKGVARYAGAFTPPGPVVGQKAFDATPLRLPVRGHRFDLAGEGVGDTALHAPRALDADLDREDGGRGILRGTVKEKALPQDTPLRRRVVLLNDLDHRVVRETWSDALTGEYIFTEIDPNRRYTVLAYDHTGTYRAVVADNLAAELMP